MLLAIKEPHGECQQRMLKQNKTGNIFQRIFKCALSLHRLSLSIAIEKSFLSIMLIDFFDSNVKSKKKKKIFSMTFS